MTTGLKTLTSTKKGEEDGYRAEDTEKREEGPVVIFLSLLST